MSLIDRETKALVMNAEIGMRPPLTFDTARLHLRPIQQGDVAAIFDTYASQHDATRYMDFFRHRDVAQSEAFAERCVRCWESDSAFPWAILDRISAFFIGTIELRLSPPVADFGYILGGRFWGQGFGREAAKAVAAWTMAQPSILRLQATCHPENHASARVLTKAGLTLEATLANGVARPQLGEAAGPSLIFAWVK